MTQTPKDTRGGKQLSMQDMVDMLDGTFIPLPDRPTFLWPGDKPVALVTVLAVEYFEPAQPALYSGGPGVLPAPIPAGALDFSNWTWRHYGNKVGLWRLLDILTRFEVPVSAVTNAKLHEVYPAVSQALQSAGCELLTAHGYIEDRSLLEFIDDPAGHRTYVLDSLAAHERATGQKARGWISPAGAMLPETFAVLAEAGIEWIGGFLSDDQPFSFEIMGRRLIGFPHNTELNDYTVFTRGHQSATVYEEAVLEHVDVLCQEGRRMNSGRVAVLPAHPHVMGQPSRVRHYEAVIRHLRDRDDIWWATQTEVASFFRDNVIGNRQR